MVASIFGNFLAKRSLIWTGAALLGVAIPAVGATTHLIHKASLTHRTQSHAMVHHKATAKTASHAKAKPASSSKPSASAAATSHAQRPGYPLSLSAVTSMHSGHVSAAPASTSTTHTTSSHAKPVSHVAAKPVSVSGTPGLHVMSSPSSSGMH
jgi:hypothetical protein